jgi:predicted dehydrogenase
MDTVKDAVNTLFGRKPTGPKIRYGVVGAGWITQAAFLPGVGQTSNSGMINFLLLSLAGELTSFFLFLVVTVLISDDPEKREKLGKEYNLKPYSYEQFSQALAEGHCDAFYIATPNNQHRKFAVPALEKGLNKLFYIIFLSN